MLAGNSFRSARARPCISAPSWGWSRTSDYELTTWWGIVAPAGTPKAIVDRLNQEIIRAVGLPEVKELLASQGAEPRTSTPQQFDDYMKEQIGFYRTIIASAGIVPE